MTLELTAARMIAPYVGSSLYTWTSMIGIVLLGVSIGNLYGGKIADKNASTKLLSKLLLIASFTTLLTPLFVHTIGNHVARNESHYLIQTIATSFIFFLPSFIIGTISPIIAKLAITSLKHSGNIVGHLFAAGAIGSIVGTYLAGFVLITILGLQTIIFLIAIIFLLAAILIFPPKPRVLSLKFWLALVFFVTLSVVNYSPAFACQTNSNYYCIKILTSKNYPDTLFLRMDQLMHSATNLKDPSKIEFGYAKFITVFINYLENPNIQTLYLGGGAYTLPRYQLHVLPSSNMEVIEIDPEVTKIAYEYFDVPTSEKLTTYNIDGRYYLKQINKEKKYDLIVSDAFSDAAVAHHLTTQEFNLLIKNRLSKDGYYIVNVIDTLSPGLFINSYLHTLNDSFEHVYLFQPIKDEITSKVRQNILVVASNKPVNTDKLKSTAMSIGYNSKDIDLLYDSQSPQNTFNIKGPILLKDDHAPTDILLNPLF